MKTMNFKQEAAEVTPCGMLSEPIDSIGVDWIQGFRDFHAKHWSNPWGGPSLISSPDRSPASCGSMAVDCKCRVHGRGLCWIATDQDEDSPAVWQYEKISEKINHRGQNNCDSPCDKMEAGRKLPCNSESAHNLRRAFRLIHPPQLKDQFQTSLAKSISILTANNLENPAINPTVGRLRYGIVRFDAVYFYGFTALKPKEWLAKGWFVWK